MLLISPNGVAVEASPAHAERLLSAGFRKPEGKADAAQPARKAAARKKAR